MGHRPPGGCLACAALHRCRLAAGTWPRRPRRCGGRVLRLPGRPWRGHGAGGEPLSGGRRFCRPDCVRRAFLADDRAGEAARGSAEPLAAATYQRDLTMLAAMEELGSFDPGLRSAATLMPGSGEIS